MREFVDLTKILQWKVIEKSKMVSAPFAEFELASTT